MVILVDSSIWVEHFRHRNNHLSSLLQEAVVAAHPFVIGKLALGRLHPRREILSLLRTLPESPTATPSELFHYIEKHGLAGSGVGFVDAHLLASTELMRGLLWTSDKPLQRVADKLDLAYA